MVEGTVRPLIERLTSAAVASCTCMTKSNNIEVHKGTCHYRLFMEAAIKLTNLEYTLKNIVNDEDYSVYDIRTIARNAI